MAAFSAQAAQTDDEPDCFYEGDPPTLAEEETGDRFDFIGDELNRAALYPADAAWHISTALDAARNHGSAPLTDRHRDSILNAIARVRPAVVTDLPEFSHARILDGLDALAELAAWCASPATMFGDPVITDALRARMRIAQNEAHNLSLVADMATGARPQRLPDLQRLVRNETENRELGADEPGRRRPGSTFAA